MAIEDTSVSGKRGIRATVGLLFSGIALGIVLSLVGLYILASTGILGSLITSHYLSQYSQLVTNTPTGQVPSAQNFTVATGTVAVPKAYASAAYFSAVNRLVPDYQQIVTVGEQLGPVLVQMQANAKTGDYGSLISLAVKAKALIAQEQQLIKQFSGDLSALTAANQSTSDSITKSLTQDTLAKGSTFSSALSDYMQSLDSLISGQVPTQSQLADSQAKGQANASAAVDFKTSLQKLLDRFKAAATQKQ
jgi:hypothetical protein